MASAHDFDAWKLDLINAEDRLSATERKLRAAARELSDHRSEYDDWADIIDSACLDIKEVVFDLEVVSDLDEGGR